jgi:ATP-dependent DNA ligase
MRQTGSWVADLKIKASFIEPILLQRTEELPQSGMWAFELKLDGFRAEAMNSGCRIHLRSSTYTTTPP